MAQQNDADDASGSDHPAEPTGADPDGTIDVATGTVERNPGSDADEENDGDVLTIRVKGAQLPEDGETLERIEDRLGTVVGDILREDYGVQAEGVTTRIGHEYTQISDNCPWCGEMVELFELEADTENGAYATAECTDDDCEFYGTAVYRLIDFERFNPEDGFEAAVNEGICTPSYYGY